MRGDSMRFRRCPAWLRSRRRSRPAASARPRKCVRCVFPRGVREPLQLERAETAAVEVEELGAPVVEVRTGSRTDQDLEFLDAADLPVEFAGDCIPSRDGVVDIAIALDLWNVCVQHRSEVVLRSPLTFGTAAELSERDAAVHVAAGFGVVRDLEPNGRPAESKLDVFAAEAE